MNQITTWYLISLLFRRNGQRDDEENTEEKKDMLCRFVHDGTGKHVGESIAIQNDLLIVKDGISFLGIPLKHIEQEGGRILVKGLVDTSKAKELGEQWRQSSLVKDDG
jgi:hypothetical protein